MLQIKLSSLISLPNVQFNAGFIPTFPLSPINCGDNLTQNIIQLQRQPGQREERHHQHQHLDHLEGGEGGVSEYE